MRKHPVIFGLLLLLMVGIAAFLLIYGMASSRVVVDPFAGKGRIGVVVIRGLISDSGEITNLLERYEKDDYVKAVVIRINSPGGGVVPAQEIYDEVLKLRKKKKVVVSMGSVAASGGYYIACAGNRIIANPGTITGSIGVIIQFSQIEELLDKIGLKPTVIKGGKYKDVGSPVREMTKDEKKLIQEVVDDIYDQFLNAVSTGRNISKEQVRAIADGKIYTGRQALHLGLVDELGNMEYTINVAAKLAGIEGKPKVLYPEERRTSFLRYLTKELISSVFQDLEKNTTGIDYLFRGGHAI
jgi:protease-4